MSFTSFTRTGTAIVAGAVLFMAVSAAGARAQTFDVVTTVMTACTVTNSGPANLSPSYNQPTNSGTGASTVLSTFCNGSDPTVTFTDTAGSGTTAFVMTNGSADLLYQISNGSTCSGVPGDGPVAEGAPVPLTPGPSGFDICAAAITTNGVNTGLPAGTYTDTVTYTIAP